MSLPERIVDKMLSKDSFSKWMDIKVIDIKEGYCKLKMNVREEMLNGFGLLHGGITYSFADSAFAFASNSTNIISVSLNTTMSYPASAREGDILFAEAEAVTFTDKTGIIDVTVTTDKNKVIGIFRGTVYRTSKKHFD